MERKNIQDERLNNDDAGQDKMATRNGRHTFYILTWYEVFLFGAESMATTDIFPPKNAF